MQIYFDYLNKHNSDNKIDLMVIPFIVEKKLSQSKLIKDLDYNFLNNLIDNEVLNDYSRPLLVYLNSYNLKRVFLLPIKEKTYSDIDYKSIISSFKIETICSEALENILFTFEQLNEADIDIEKYKIILSKFFINLSFHLDNSFNFQTKNKNEAFKGKLKKVVIIKDDIIDDNGITNIESHINYLNALIKGLNLYRSLANSPSNICNPNYLVTKANELSEKYRDITTQVYDETKLKELGMNGILSVGSGSSNNSYLIKMEYNPNNIDKDQKSITFIGKSVTFDSGGISIKPSEQMHHMKFDMSGGATLFGLIETIANLKLDKKITVLIAACENMPDGNSYRPSDIISMHNKLTVEILNTDAEGRLALADALSYADKVLNSEIIIDIATLTGACHVALGSVNTGLFSNSEKLTKKLLEASNNSGDKIWPMPMDQEYNDCIKSPNADLSNCGIGRGGAITAAKFLENFISNDKIWAHLDIAGTAYTQTRNARSTGRPLPLLVEYLRSDLI